MYLTKNTTLEDITNSEFFKEFLQIELDKYKYVQDDVNSETLQKIVNSEWYNAEDFSKVYTDCLSIDSKVLPLYEKEIVLMIGNKAFNTTVKLLLEVNETKMLLKHSNVK